MSEEKLNQILKPFIDDVKNEAISDYTCIFKHAELLLQVRASGITVKTIVEISGISYSRSMFSNKLSQFKRKLALTNKESASIAVKESLLKSPSLASSCKPPQTVNKIVSDNASPELIYSLDEWTTATRLGEGSIHIFQQGEDDGLIPSDFNNLTSCSNLKIINIFAAWEETVSNTIVSESKKPTKEQFLSNFKGVKK